MSKFNGVRKVQNAEILPSDVVNGRSAVRAIDDLLCFLGPVLRGTRRHGDKQGVEFIAGLMADLGVLREGLAQTIDS